MSVYTLVASDTSRGYLANLSTTEAQPTAVKAVDAKYMKAQIEATAKEIKKITGPASEVFKLLSQWATRLDAFSSLIGIEKTKKEAEKSEKVDFRRKKQQSKSRSTQRTLRIHQLDQEISRLGNDIFALKQLQNEFQTLLTNIRNRLRYLSLQMPKTK